MAAYKLKLSYGLRIVREFDVEASDRAAAVQECRQTHLQPWPEGVDGAHLWTEDGKRLVKEFRPHAQRR